MKTRRVVSYAMCLATAGCASSPGSIDASYVSPSIYQNFSCAQLFEEKQRLFNNVERVSGLQRENANADTALMTVGLVIFWPALFGLAATKDREVELARLKGEYEAVDSQITMKQCVPPTPTSPASTQEVTAPATPASSPAETQSAVQWSGTGLKDGCDKPYSIDLLVQDKRVKGQLDRGGVVYAINGNLNSSGDLEDSLAPLKNATPSSKDPNYLNINLDFSEETATGGYSTFDGNRFECTTVVTLKKASESS